MSITGPPVAPCLVTDKIRYNVEVNPGAFAVHCENEQPCTYAELWQLALTIMSNAKIAPGFIVPICMDPTIEYVATILAVLIAGSAYTILDPEGAPERNRAIVENTGGDLVMVHEKYAPLFESSCSVEQCLRRPSISLSRRGSCASIGKRGSLYLSGATSQDIAYLTYTSGLWFLTLLSAM